MEDIRNQGIEEPARTRSGELLARVLEETGIPYLVIELDPDGVRRARDQGAPVL